MIQANHKRRKVETLRLDDDPLWYKDALIYELHVRAFQDSDGDGSGDFRGLLEKLPYLQDLGVNAIWLLPFYPSPGRDDGYDIADYTDVNPMYGTLADAHAFVTLPQPPGIGAAYNEISSRDLSTSKTTAWVYRPGSSLYVVAAADGSIVVQAYDQGPGALLVASEDGLVVAESGIGWIPFALERMDHEFGKYLEAREGWEARGGIPLTMQPSEYFRRQVWATFQDDPAGVGLLSMIGEDRVMWASDYPHPDSTWPNSQRVIAAQMAGLPEDTRRKLTRENARALYGLN